MLLLLVRHGESEGNLTGRWQGITDGPLTPLGLVQAQLLAQRLQQVKLSLILSSPLCRALDTAIAVYNAQQEPKPPLMTSEWLIEVNMGSFENQPWSMCQWVVDPRLGARATPFPGQGGESLDDLFMRALHIADYLLQAKLDTVLIISHGIFLKELVHALCMRAGDDMSWQQVGWSNSGMTVIE